MSDTAPRLAARVATRCATRASVPPTGRRKPFLTRLLDWLDRIEQRRCLAALTARELADVGLTRDQVDAECSKPFWR